MSLSSNIYLLLFQKKYGGIVLLLMLSFLSLVTCIKAEILFDTGYCDAAGSEISAFCPLLTINGDCCPLIMAVMEMGSPPQCLCHLLNSENFGFTAERCVEFYYKCKGSQAVNHYTNLTNTCESRCSLSLSLVSLICLVVIR